MAEEKTIVKMILPSINPEVSRIFKAARMATREEKDVLADAIGGIIKKVAKYAINNNEEVKHLLRKHNGIDMSNAEANRLSQIDSDIINEG